MPTETTIAVEPTSTATEQTSADFEIDTVGIEFEYPTTDDPDNAPAVEARDSTELRNMSYYGSEGRGGSRDCSWPIGSGEIPGGEMTSDHVGAEITSAQLDLHTTQPEAWYVGSIQRATEMGYPFAATGHGDTVFGMHLHLSELPRHKARELYDLSQEPWFRTFICSSVDETTADPWRHGGVSYRELSGERPFGSQHCVNPRIGDRHYEWRMPEPVLPDHFEMVMHFLRLIETDGVAEARRFARSRVDAADGRLTAVQQYTMYREREGEEYVQRVRENARSDDEYDRRAANFLIDLMENE